MPASTETKELLQSLLSEGDKVVETLQQKIPTDAHGRMTHKRVSDVVDKEGYQYVNLVQQGGGVLGIALLGYTYVLERMGIRFLKLAGTSAGAINSSMLACVRPESVHTCKSPVILYYLAQKNLFDLVDGHPIARTLIRNLVKTRQDGEPGYATRLAGSIRFLLLASLPLIFLSSLLLWQNPKGVASLLFWTAGAFVISWLLYLAGKQRNAYTSGGGFTPTVLFFLGTALFIGIVYLLGRVPAGDSLQLFLEFAPIAGLFLYSLFLIFSKKYYRPIQIGCSAVLAVVLYIGYLNKFLHVTFFFRHEGRLWELPTYVFLSATGISLFFFFVLFVGSIGFFLLMKFRDSRFGINPGRNFREWIAGLMEDGSVDISLEVNGKEVRIANPKNGVTNVATLNDYCKTWEKAGVEYRPPLHTLSEAERKELTRRLIAFDEAHPPVSIITAEVVTQNKIVFPRMWPLFWTAESEVEPADFVRASMSLPVFFETFKREFIPRPGRIPDYWDKFLHYHGNVPKDAVFQDGGILSNFPINLFYNPGLESPRLPTFGIRLNDADEPDSSVTRSLGGLLWSMFNTTRYYYDKDFLISNPHYELCIGNVDVRRFNWIDFNMKTSDKIALFAQGARAAAAFLENFDWDQYKIERSRYRAGDSAAADPAGTE